MITGALLEPVVDPEEGPAPLFLDQTVMRPREPEKNILEPAPPPLSKGLDYRPLPLISRSLDLALF